MCHIVPTTLSTHTATSRICVWKHILKLNYLKLHLKFIIIIMLKKKTLNNIILKQLYIVFTLDRLLIMGRGERGKNFQDGWFLSAVIFH